MSRAVVEEEPRRSPLSDDELMLMQSVRDDRLNRPDFYSEGFGYLRRNYGSDAQIRRTLRLGGSGYAGKPRFVLGAAFRGLSDHGIRPRDHDSLSHVDPAAAKAVVCLTWLLTDPGGDAYPASRGFGSFAENRRYIRWGTVDDDRKREPWLQLVRQAAKLLAVPPLKSDPPPEPEATHADDYTSVDWFGTPHRFGLGQQSRAVAALWKEWERGGHTLHEKSIGELAKSESGNFRLEQLFRRHAAWGSMIVKGGKPGTYRLGEPPPKPVGK